MSETTPKPGSPIGWMVIFPTPKPGADLARRSGCRCDMIRNGYGKGAFVSGGGEVQYDINPKCPLHGMDA